MNKIAGLIIGKNRCIRISIRYKRPSQTFAFNVCTQAQSLDDPVMPVQPKQGTGTAGS